MLLFSIYAPQWRDGQQVERAQFTQSLLEVTCQLVMQIPTLLLGDFNGSALPMRDYHSPAGERRMGCPALTAMLGPGGAWVDAQVALGIQPLPWTFRGAEVGDQQAASRIDLILANHAALGLIRGVHVLHEVRDGGHSPVVAEVQIDGVASLQWFSPRPRLPPLLMQSSRELNDSPEWSSLVLRWEASSEARIARETTAEARVADMSLILVKALQVLVAQAGG